MDIKTSCQKEVLSMVDTKNRFQLAFLHAISFKKKYDIRGL